MKTKLLRFCVLSLMLYLAAPAAAETEYGRGYDVYTTAAGVALHGDVLLMTWPAGANRDERHLVAVDVADPAEPVVLGQLALEGFPQDLVIADDLAYIVNGRDLLVVEIADLASLRLRHALRIDDDPLKGPQGIALGDNTAWLACRGGGIKAVDVSDADAPRIVAAVDVDAFVRGVGVVDDRLYVAGDTRGLFVFDIATPSQPEQLHHVPATEGSIGRVRVHDDVAHLAAGNLLVANVLLGNPASPQWAGATADRELLTAYFGSYAHALDVGEMDDHETGETRVIAVVADGESGLIVADVSELANPHYLGGIKGNGGPQVATGVVLRQITAYVVDESFGLRVVDVSDPEAPTPLGEGVDLTQ